MATIIKSSVPLNSLPEINVFSFLFSNANIAVPDEHIVTIDVPTDTPRTRLEHVRRVRRLATAFTTPRNLGGLGIPPLSTRVGILSEGHVARISSVSPRAPQNRSPI